MKIYQLASGREVNMDQIRKSIEEILGLDANGTEAVVNRLAEIGACCFSDLVDVTVSDLTPSVLMPIPARKLVRLWANSTNESQNGNNPATSSHLVPSTSTMTTPSSRNSQLPVFSTPVTDSWSVNLM